MSSERLDISKAFEEVELRFASANSPCSSHWHALLGCLIDRPTSFMPAVGQVGNTFVRWALRRAFFLAAEKYLTAIMIANKIFVLSECPYSFVILGWDKYIAANYCISNF